MDFEKEVIEEMQKAFPGATISIDTVVKSNLTYRGLMIREEGQTAVPTINIDGFRSAVENGEIDFSQAIAYITDTYYDGMANVPSVQDINKTNILGKVQFRLMNADRNTVIADTSPYKKFEDLILVPYFEVESTPDVTSSARVTYNLMSNLGISETELFEACEKNATPVVTDMATVMRGILGGDLDEEAEAMLAATPDNSMLVVTNKSKSYGAASFLAEGIMEKACEIMGEDVFVLPSSVHEVLIVPSSKMSLKDAKSMVEDVNATTVSASDFLSDNVYVFSREQNKFLDTTPAQTL